MSEDTHVKALTAENARLRQNLAAVEGDMLRILDQRDAAIAEREVLRHRDRRTQAVVDAAQAWFDHRRGSLNALADALDELQNGTASPPGSPLPAEQPSDVAQEATDGLEAQGGAQRAEWEYATTTGPRKQWDDGDVPPEGEGWERDPDRGDEGWERFDYHEESYWRRPLKRTPPVLLELTLVPDPVPDSSQYITAAELRSEGFDVPTGSDTINDNSLSHMVANALAPACNERYPGGDPLARIVRCGLPSGHEGNHDEMINGERGNHWPRKPDGEVPEAGRAGEAQTSPTGPAPAFVGLPNETTKEIMTAAIVAFLQSQQVDRWPDQHVMAAVRAASPLIERAALHAAADELEASPWLGHQSAAKRLRARATRTETS